MPEGKSKKRSRPTLEQLKARPWCYFCERDFDDVSYLIAHQRAKHYKCDECSRRLNTANGLVVHKQQVHKSTVPCIENCTVDGREVVPAPEIFGMEGMPPELLGAYHQRIEIAFFKEEQEYRAKTGNPPPGTVSGTNGAKRAKIETPEEMKARLAEHRAKRAAEKAALKQQGSATPDVKHEASATPPDSHAGTAFPPPGMAAAVQAPAQPGFPPPGPEGYPMPGPQGYPGPGPHGYPMPGQPGFHPGYGPPMGMPPQGMPPQGLPPQGMPPQGMPPQGWLPGFPPPQAYSPVNMPPYHGPPQQGYPPMHHQPAGPPQYGGPVHRPRQNNAPSPASPANGHPQPSTLPPALGLPARPSFDPPKISHDGMQRMHTGQAPPLNNDRPYPPYRGPQPVPAQQQPPSGEVDQSVADLIKDVERELAEKARAASTSASAGGEQGAEQVAEPTPTSGEPAVAESIPTDVHAASAAPETAAVNASAPEEAAPAERAAQPTAPDAEKPVATSEKKSKKSKKSKDMITKLMYDDNTTSLEEKMAALSKYAFHRPSATEYTLDQVGAAVTGTERGEDDVVDVAH